MNKIDCKIESVKIDGIVALIKLKSSFGMFSSILISQVSSYSVGESVNAVFKDSEVMICDKSYTKISARNRFVSKISGLELSEIFAKVEFMVDGYKIESLISKEAALELKLKIGEEFAWFVKSTEVMIDRD